VPFIVGSLINPSLEAFDLIQRETFPMFDGGHPIIRILGQYPLDHQAGISISGDHSRNATQIFGCPLQRVQSQTLLPSPFTLLTIRTMTFQAVCGEDRANVPVE
jgi:hypothetical protein